MHDIPTTQRMTYLRGLLQGYGTLSLPLGSGLSFSLLQVFQPLRLRKSAADEQKQQKNNNEEIHHDTHKDTRGDEEPEERKKDQDVPEVLAENGIEALNKSQCGRIVILGGPGTGKTTVLKHLLYYHAQQALEESTALLPIFLSLPELARMGQDLDSYLAHIALEMGLDADYGRALSHAIVHGRAFVCLDSLDEVLPRQRAGIIRQINELAQGSNTTWVIGSRFTDYKGGQFQHGQFQEWELQPLDPESRLRLATQLLPELQRQLVVSGQSMNNLDPRAYVQTLSEHRQASTWGMNPLLFSLGAVAYLRRGNLSGSRAMLYREVIAALLETRGGDALLLHILADIALDLYQIKGRTFTLDDLHAALMRLHTTQRITWSIEDMRYRVLNSGVLDVVAVETYSFRHQTFQEYLVASALARRFMSEDEQTREAAHQLAWSKHTYSRWNEVERLFVGILVQEYGAAGAIQACVWLTRLLRQRESGAGDPGNLSLELAIKSLSEVAQLEEWQATTEALELEEMAATVWSAGVTKLQQEDRQYSRYPAMAAEIGRLRPSAQQKAIEMLLNVGHIHEVLSAIHSSYVTHYLLEALKRYPDSRDQKRIKSIFRRMGEFAPVDFLLDELSDQKNRSETYSVGDVEKMALCMPAEKIVPILLLPTSSGCPYHAEHLLIEIAKRRELPIQDLLTIAYGDQKEASFRAARVLASVQHPAAIDPLLTHLNDADEYDRKDALQALSVYKTLLPLDRIIAMLGDSDVAVRGMAVSVLAGFGSAAPLEPLIQIAHDPHASIRRQAIEVLGQLGDQSSLDVLIQAVGDPHSRVARAAILALGSLGHRAPLELLLSFLDKEKLVSPTLEALSQKQIVGRVPVQPLLDLYARNWQVRKEILNVLINMGHPTASDLLVSAICNEYQCGENRTIYQSGENSSIITQLLKEKQASWLIADRIDEIAARCYPVSNRAVLILGSWQDRRAVDVLLQALADERWRVSDAAATALCKRADEPVQADLLALLTHRDAWVRKNALLVLAECSNPPPVELVAVALHDGNERVRAAAAKALRKHVEDAPLDELFAATLDDSIVVRREAAVTLSKMGQRDPALAVAGVVNLLRHENVVGEESPWDGDGSLAQKAFEEMSAFITPEMLLQAMYDLGGSRSLTPAYALERMGERVPIEELARALQDENEDMQLAAAVALSRTGKRTPVAALINALATVSPYVQRAVIDALTKASEYGDVPDEVFLQRIVEKGHNGTYIPLFEAFTAQKKLIPEDLVLDVLDSFLNRHSSAVVQYLSQLADLPPAFPEKSVAVALALYAVDQSYYGEPDEAGIIKRLLPKLSVGSLLEVLTHPESEIRMGALCLLAEYPGAVPLEAIQLALRDPNAMVRCEAIECLQKRPESLPIQSIIACLQDTSSSARWRAIRALGSLGEQAPLPELIAMLDALTPEERYVAAYALAQPSLRERVPTEMLINVLDGDYTYYCEERDAVLEALCEKDPHRAIEHCIAVLGNSDDDFALRAFQLLQQMHPAVIPEIVQEATALLQGGTPGRFLSTLSTGFIADVIGDMDQAVPGLVVWLGELLDWPYWEVRVKAARALGKQRRNIPDAAIRRLLELRHDSHSLAVREATDVALAEILSLEDGIEDD